MSNRSSDGSGSPSRYRSRCPARHRTPVVLVAIRHRQLRRWTTELLESACGCWTTVPSFDGELLVDALARNSPDVVAVDSVDFPVCCEEALARLEPGQVVVVGPEPDPAYRRSSLDRGAGGWVSQDHLGDEVTSAVWAALGCDCQPCPLQPLMTMGTGSTSADTTPRPTGEPT